MLTSRCGVWDPKSASVLFLHVKALTQILIEIKQFRRSLFWRPTVYFWIFLILQRAHISLVHRPRLLLTTKRNCSVFRPGLIPSAEHHTLEHIYGHFHCKLANSDYHCLQYTHYHFYISITSGAVTLRGLYLKGETCSLNSLLSSPIIAKSTNESVPSLLANY